MNIHRASAACDPQTSPGRQFDEPHSTTRGPRSMFQRDRDRIIHSIAFRRLRHKTQVFINPDGDHYRVRLTHSLEVAQIGRTIARALGLDEDLTEALCLAHDIGHPPFGHAGEDALSAALQQQGGFDHNAQTLRALVCLECPYPAFPGLNLSWDVLEGLAKHNGPVADPSWALAAINTEYDLHLTKWPSLEAQVAAVADDIAYDNHDIDDGLRAGFLCFDDLLELDFMERQWRDVCVRFPDIAPERLRGEFIRDHIGLMVNDVIQTTRQNLASQDIRDVNDVRNAGRQLAGFSPEMAARERRLKRFMYARLYHHPAQVAAADHARVVIASLFAAYRSNAETIPQEWRDRLPHHEPEHSRHIADFVAGMTDRFALRECQRLRIAIPDGLAFL